MSSPRKVGHRRVLRKAKERNKVVVMSHMVCSMLAHREAFLLGTDDEDAFAEGRNTVGGIALS